MHSCQSQILIMIPQSHRLTEGQIVDSGEKTAKGETETIVTAKEAVAREVTDKTDLTAPD